MGLGGLEPPTSRLSGVRSNLLSYRPITDLGCQSTDLRQLLKLLRSFFLSLFCYLLSPVSKLLLRGGDEEDRTPDLLRAKQALSQLSYTPVYESFTLRC